MQPDIHDDEPILSGRVFWITGLSGSGKTTVAMQLHQRWIELGNETLLLDGDEVRSLFGSDLGHEAEDREVSAWRNARMCVSLAEAGFDVICATISMFEDVRSWLRENAPGYLEIFLRVPEQERRTRDPKGLYEQASSNQGLMAGLNQSCDLPVAPDLILDNHDDLTPKICVERILELAHSSTSARVPAATS
ncbi:MAG: adenylylsulfate kinase-like enzyme [Planctomycetota bacterium]|jgi:adenylylsulfate kinase-like enzyme